MEPDAAGYDGCDIFDDQLTPGNDQILEKKDSVNPQDFFGKKISLMNDIVSDP